MKKIWLILFIIIIIPKNIFAKINNVAFISQVLPGNWEETLNCGQTSYYMVMSYLNNIKDEDALDYNEIKKIDDWLYEKYKDPINNYNGYYTTIEKLKSIAEDKDGIKNVYTSYGIQDLDKIKTEIDNNNIVIVLVRTNMSVNKDGHFMILIGYDDEYLYFNDPGKMIGRKRKYLEKTFLKTWKTQNYEYMIIKNNISEDIGYGADYKDNNGILFNKTIKNGDNTLTTVIRENNNKLQIITVETEMEKNEEKFLIENDFDFSDIDKIEETEEDKESINFATQKLGNNLYENNWLKIAENLIIDYNIPKVIAEEDVQNNVLEEDNDWQKICDYGYGDDGKEICIVEDGIEDVFSYGYGENIENENYNQDNAYGYGDIIEDKNLEEYDLDFEFYNNYESDRLLIPLSWKPINNNDLMFTLDYKIDDGNWENIFVDSKLLKYNFYVKYNKHNYFFRIKSSYNSQYSQYLELMQNIDLTPKDGQSYLGNIDKDTILSEGNEYFCYSCLLSAGNILLVEKNVKIKIGANAVFNIFGDLIVMGEKDNGVVILSVGNNIPGAWGFIKFIDNEFIELNYLDVGYGGYDYFSGTAGSMISVNNVNNFIVNNSNFHDNYFTGGNIDIDNSIVKIKNSKFYNSSKGLSVSNSIGDISNNEFYYNDYNVILSNVYKDLKIYNNKILNARGYAVFGNNILADIRDNIFKDNVNNYIFMNFLNLENNSKEILNKNVYGICSVNIPEDASLKIDSGCVFKAYSNCGIFKIDGEIIIDGDSEPIVFTSYFDDRYGGDTNFDNNNTSPKSGDWGYLEFGKTASGIINNAVFSYGGYHYLSSTNHGMVFLNETNDIEIKNSVFNNGFYQNIEIIDSYNINVFNNTIKNASLNGIEIRNGENIKITNNNFVNNGVGLWSIGNNSLLNENNTFENDGGEFIKIN